MAQSNINIGSTVFNPGVTDTAFAAVLPEIMALSDEDTLPVNTDVVAGAALVLGRIHLLRTLRSQMLEELPRFDIGRFDKLDQYALALSHAHGLHRGAQLPKAQIATLGNALAEIRDRLYGNAMSLAQNGLLDGTRLKDCKSAIGYRAVATDVLTLVPVFKEYWSNIEGKTPITPALLQEAQNRAAELITSVGLRATNADVVGEKAQIRAKAFTLFLQAYEDTRDAVAFLRRKEKDAADFAPSLYVGRGGRRRDEGGDEPEPNEAAAREGSATASKTDRPEAATHVITANPEGLPIDNPFTSN